jgi:2,4-dienoyl-CoA reductase (NADPH2)
MPAMHLGMSSDGHVSGEELQFYKERARENLGLVIVGLCNTHPLRNTAIKGVLEISDDQYIDGMAKLHRTIADGDALSAVQLSPMAGYNTPTWMPDSDLLEELIESIGTAAFRVHQAGFEMVELMLSGGSLLSHFLSPHHNTSSLKEFSGSLQNRLRAPRMAIHAIQKHAPQLPIVVRMHGHEYLENGYGLTEAAQIALALEAEGVAAINVTVAGHRTAVPQITRQRSAESFGFLGRNIRDAVGTPVFYGSRIRNAEDAISVFRSSGADAITIGRALIADPQFATRLKMELERKPEKTVDDNSTLNCIACCQCLDMVFGKKPVHCTVNPAVKAISLTEKPAPKSVLGLPSQQGKQVVVAGSGPAGLHAAIGFARQGATVTLLEQTDTLGGKWQRISRADSHAQTRGALRGTIRLLDTLPIRIKLNTSVSPALIRQLTPDVLVLATGARKRVIEIPGLHCHPRVHHVDDLIDLERPPHFNNAVVIGGNAAGVTIALQLASPGFATNEAIGFFQRFGSSRWATEAAEFVPAKKVTILKRRGYFGKGMGRATRWTALQEMAVYGIDTIDRVQYEEVTETGLWIQRGRQNTRQFLNTDLIVLSTGFESTVSVDDYINLVAKVVVTGDADHVSNITDAINNIYPDTQS